VSPVYKKADHSSFEQPLYTVVTVFPIFLTKPYDVAIYKNRLKETIYHLVETTNKWSQFMVVLENYENLYTIVAYLSTKRSRWAIVTKLCLLSVFCLYICMSVINYFLRMHLLLNHFVKLNKASQKCGPLSKLLNQIQSIENSD